MGKLWVYCTSVAFRAVGVTRPEEQSFIDKFDDVCVRQCVPAEGCCILMVISMKIHQQESQVLLGFTQCLIQIMFDLLFQRLAYTNSHPDIKTTCLYINKRTRQVIPKSTKATIQICRFVWFQTQKNVCILITFFLAKSC